MKKEVRFRHRLINSLAKVILIPYYKRKYRYSYKKLKELKGKGPFLVLSNHTVPEDPIIISFAFPFVLYFFATEQIFNLGWLSKLLKYAANPISKSKSVSDMNAIRKSKNIIKQGGSVALFPEGNVTYNGQTSKIDIQIVKLIRLLKVPVILYRTQGLYLANPRWALFKKKGRSSGELFKIIEPGNYQNMSDTELLNLINDALFVSYLMQAKRVFKGMQRSEGLERFLFMDLDLNIANQVYSKDDKILSHASDFELTYQEDGMLLTKDKQLLSLIELDERTKNSYIKYLQTKKLDDEIVTIDVNLHQSLPTKKDDFGMNQMSLYPSKITLIFEKEQIVVPFDNVINIAVQGKKKIIIYLEHVTWLLTLKDMDSPYQILLTYQIFQQLKEKQTYDFIDISKLGLQ